MLAGESLRCHSAVHVQDIRHRAARRTHDTARRPRHAAVLNTLPLYLIPDVERLGDWQGAEAVLEFGPSRPLLRHRHPPQTTYRIPSAATSRLRRHYPGAPAVSKDASWRHHLAAVRTPIKPSAADRIHDSAACYTVIRASSLWYTTGFWWSSFNSSPMSYAATCSSVRMF